MTTGKQKEIAQAIAQGNDDKALGFLYKACLPKIKRMVYRLGGTNDDAKDVFQDGVLVLYRKIRGEGMVYENIEAFFFTLCRNLWINKLRRERKMLHPEVLPEREDVQADIHHHMMVKEYNKGLEELFDRLGERCAQLLKLVYVRQMRPEEIVREMDMSSTDVVKTTKNRCKNKLVELLDEHPQLARNLSLRG